MVSPVVFDRRKWFLSSTDIRYVIRYIRLNMEDHPLKNKDKNVEHMLVSMKTSHILETMNGLNFIS